MEYLQTIMDNKGGILKKLIYFNFIESDQYKKLVITYMIKFCMKDY